MRIGVLWAGLRVAMWITHVGGKFGHGLLAKSLKKVTCDPQGPKGSKASRRATKVISRSQTREPRRGKLKSAGKQQESGTFLQHSFPMLHCTFSLAAAQLLVKRTSALQKSECCSATSAAQPSKNCSATSVFACGMLQGWGLEGWGLGLAEVTFFITKSLLSLV